MMVRTGADGAGDDEEKLDGEHDEQSEVWSEVGPPLAASVCDRRRADIDDALHEIASCWRTGEDVDVDDVRRAREVLNAARRFVEDVAAPVAGAEPWGSPPPSIPVGAIREHYGEIRPADDVDDGSRDSSRREESTN